jgi:hypothetical protein
MSKKNTSQAQPASADNSAPAAPAATPKTRNVNLIIAAAWKRAAEIITKAKAKAREEEATAKIVTAIQEINSDELLQTIVESANVRLAVPFVPAPRNNPSA